MANKSGTLGSVQVDGSTILDVTKWSINKTCNITPFASNSSGGAKKRVAGSKDITGSCEGKYDPTMPIEDHLGEGDSVTITLVRDTGDTIGGAAVVDELTLDCDMDSGDPQSWTVSFGANGAWT